MNEFSQSLVFGWHEREFAVPVGEAVTQGVLFLGVAGQPQRFPQSDGRPLGRREEQRDCGLGQGQPVLAGSQKQRCK